MNLRLLPWAAMALLVLLLAIRSALPTYVVAVPAWEPGPETSGGGPEIRLGPVDVRELRDDGSCGLAYRLCLRYLKNSPSVDRMSVVSGPMVFR